MEGERHGLAAVFVGRARLLSPGGRGFKPLVHVLETSRDLGSGDTKEGGCGAHALSTHRAHLTPEGGSCMSLC